MSNCESPKKELVGSEGGWTVSALPVSESSVLDIAQQMLADGRIEEAVHGLVAGTRRLRDLMPPEDWTRFARSECRSHPTTGLIHQSPYTRRAFEKPRGYPGDAEILDFAYGCAPLPQGTTPLGAQIYEFELQTSGSKSARARRDLLASMVDEVADQRRMPRVLSIACGHLREAQISEAVRSGRVGRYVAFDQDPLSLAVVDQQHRYGDREHRYGCVQTIEGSVRSLLARHIEFSGFDFVYAAGLYDYLSEPVAAKLTALMFSMLAPGGRLLAANFAPEWECIGYLEAFMDWHLIYRNESQMQELARNIPAQEVSSLSVFRDPYENLVFLEVHKR
jgi:hypothetical protein